MDGNTISGTQSPRVAIVRVDEVSGAGFEPRAIDEFDLQPIFNRCEGWDGRCAQVVERNRSPYRTRLNFNRGLVSGLRAGWPEEQEDPLGFSGGLDLGLKSKEVAIFIAER